MDWAATEKLARPGAFATGMRRSPCRRPRARCGAREGEIEPSEFTWKRRAALWGSRFWLRLSKQIIATGMPSQPSFSLPNGTSRIKSLVAGCVEITWFPSSRAVAASAAGPIPQ